MSGSWPNACSATGSAHCFVADPNRAHFVSVVELLAPLLDRLVFVGGATTGLFISDVAASSVRVTRDVDSIVDVTTYAQYADLSDELRALGLSEDTSEGAPLCRWRGENVLVDVMPTDERILGFSNRWYPVAINTAQVIDIGRNAARIVTPPLFVATKLEAFHGRGAGDVFRSHDLEDIAAVVDGREELIDEIAAANGDVRMPRAKPAARRSRSGFAGSPVSDIANLNRKRPTPHTGIGRVRGKAATGAAAYRW